MSWSGSWNSANLVIVDSAYFAECTGPVWPLDVFTIAEGDLVEDDFELRAGPELSFCWE